MARFSVFCALRNTRSLTSLAAATFSSYTSDCGVVIRHRNAGGVETVGFDDVGAGIQIRLVDAADYIRTGQHQQVVAFQIGRPILNRSPR